MKRYAELREQGASTVADRLDMLAVHQGTLRGHIAQLQASDEALTRKIATYRAMLDGSRLQNHSDGSGEAAQYSTTVVSCRST